MKQKMRMRKGGMKMRGGGMYMENGGSVAAGNATSRVWRPQANQPAAPAAIAQAPEDHFCRP